MKTEQQLPLWHRFYIYQQERFPLLGNGVLIAIFTFSAVSYSRICRGENGFIQWKDYIIGAFATITLFLLVRIFDEHKDRVEDAKFRTYLPVPRGLISLAELRNIGWAIALIQIAVIAIFQPQMFLLYALVISYLLLMGVEFFVPKWLKKHQIIYITSHMVIIPLVDIYSSGLDWLLAGAKPHLGLVWFFAVSYMNGIVLEFGRKLRAPEFEEPGVISYTGMYGLRGGTLRWLGILVSTLLLAIGAAHYAGFGKPATVALIITFAICATPALIFLKSPNQKTSKLVEGASALWTALMYLFLGAIPMLMQLLSR